MTTPSTEPFSDAFDVTVDDSEGPKFFRRVTFSDCGGFDDQRLLENAGELCSVGVDLSVEVWCYARF